METIEDTDLRDCLSRLASGDPAFLFTLVARHGARIAEAVRGAGVPTDRVEEVVFDIAFTVSARAGEWDPTTAAWDFVATCVAGVLDGAGGELPVTAAAEHGATATTVTTPRAVHLVDLENLAGGPRVDRHRVLTTWRCYEHVAGTRADDHVTVAAERALWKKVAFDIDPAVRFLPGVGADGADNALLGSVEPDWVAERFDQLVIGSGDGGFTDLALTTADRGVPVVVVAVPGSLSGRLRRAADEVRWLPRPGCVTDQVERRHAGRLVSAA